MSYNQGFAPTFSVTANSQTPFSLDVLRVTELEQLLQCLDIRRSVFIDEQNVPASLELDEYDGEGTDLTAANNIAVHFLALVGGLPAGTGRLILPQAGQKAKVGRIATLAHFRRKGVAKAIMLQIHEHALSIGCPGCYLGAQISAKTFYESIGYKAKGEVFLDAGIEHIWMEREF